jgi:DNA primase
MEAPVPFAEFQVRRELELADLFSGQGKQDVIERLSPVFAELDTGPLRDELVRIVSNQTGLSPDLTDSLLRSAASGNGEPRKEQPTVQASKVEYARALDAPERAERAFLAQCLAAPNAGRDALTDIDVGSTFTSDLTRRAAELVRQHLSGQAAQPSAEDEELARLLAQLMVTAGQMRASEAALEGERLSFELLRIEREIASARAAAAGDVTRLVTRRQELKRDRDSAIARAMEETLSGGE